jgi:hypothetical protein
VQYGQNQAPAYPQYRRPDPPPPATANSSTGEGKWHHFGEKPGP